MKMNELYIAPSVEVVNVTVEKGFAASDKPWDDNSGDGSDAPAGV